MLWYVRDFTFLAYHIALTWLREITSWFTPSSLFSKKRRRVDRCGECRINKEKPVRNSHFQDGLNPLSNLLRYRQSNSHLLKGSRYLSSTTSSHSHVLSIILDLNTPAKSILFKPKITASEQSLTQPFHSAHQIEVVRADLTTFTQATIIVNQPTPPISPHPPLSLHQKSTRQQVQN